MSNKIEVGSVVSYHSIIGFKPSSTGHVVKLIELQPNNFGDDVAWITGKSGCVSIEHLTLEVK